MAGSSSISAALCAPRISPPWKTPPSACMVPTISPYCSSTLRKLDLHAHAREHVQHHRARRIQQHRIHHQVRARKQRRRAQEKRNRRQISRHVSLHRVQLLSAAHAHPVAVARHLGAEGPQRQLGVVAGAHRLNHRGLALGKQTGQQHAALHLRAGHRRLILHRLQLRAMDGQRRAAIVRLDLRAHLLQRVDHPAHRPLAQRRVANHHAGKRLRGHHAAQHAHGRAAVAAVQLALGSLQRARHAIHLHVIALAPHPSRPWLPCIPACWRNRPSWKSFQTPTCLRQSPPAWHSDARPTCRPPSARCPGSASPLLPVHPYVSILICSPRSSRCIALGSPFH